MKTIGALAIFAALPSCASVDRYLLPMTATATEVASATDGTPRQILISIEESGRKWPALVAMDGQVATPPTPRMISGHDGEYGAT